MQLQMCCSTLWCTRALKLEVSPALPRRWSPSIQHWNHSVPSCLPPANTSWVERCTMWHTSSRICFRSLSCIVVIQFSDSLCCWRLFNFELFRNSFPSVLWHCWLGDRKGIRPLKKDLVLVCWWWWFDWTYSSSSPVVTTTSIILCFNKHRLTQVHLDNGRQKRTERII